MSAADLRTVAHYSTAAEAVLARNRLLDAGIQAAVADEFMATADPLLNGAIDFVKVQVRADEFDRAAALLDLDAPAVDDADAADPTPHEADEEFPLNRRVRHSSARRRVEAGQASSIQLVVYTPVVQPRPPSHRPRAAASRGSGQHAQAFHTA